MAKRKMVKCDKCGESYGIGDYPFCPHGRAGAGLRSGFESYVEDMMFPNDEVINSASDVDRLAKKYKLVPKSNQYRKGDRWV